MPRQHASVAQGRICFDNCTCCHTETIMMMVLNSAIQDFSLSPHCAASCLNSNYVQITCNMSCATWYKGTAQLLSLTECKSHLHKLYFHWLKPLTDKDRHCRSKLPSHYWHWANQSQCWSYNPWHLAGWTTGASILKSPIWLHLERDPWWKQELNPSLLLQRWTAYHRANDSGAKARVLPELD